MKYYILYIFLSFGTLLFLTLAFIHSQFNVFRFFRVEKLLLTSFDDVINFFGLSLARRLLYAA